MIRDTAAADLPELVRIHAEAFSGEIGPIVGRRYLEAFLGSFLTIPGGVSLVASDASLLQGYAFGAPDGYGPGLTRSLLPQIAYGVVRHLPSVLMHPSFGRQVRTRVANIVLRREPTSPIFEATPPGCFCLVGVGTAVHARGKGVGKALVEGLCARAGGRQVILDVFKDNTAARAVYDRCGFRALVVQGRVIRMIRDR